MKIALITGGNKGIGLATAKQLLLQGHFVYLGSRDIARGNAAVHGLSNVKAIQLDVTDPQSILSSQQIIEQEHGRLDVLINNAGISGAIPQSAANSDINSFKEVYEVNVYGVINVTQVFLPLLRKSDAPRIVNVSTSVGSLTLQSDPNWPAYDYAKYAVYASSKAAMNMFTVQLAYELRDTNLKVNAVCPGYTKTDFTNHQGGDVAMAAARIVKYALDNESIPTGKFISEETNPLTGEIPW